MARGLFKLTTAPLGENKAVQELIGQWPERLKHVQPMLPYLAANYLMRYVRQKLPKGSEYRAYRQGLEVAKVRGLSDGQYAYTLQVDMKSRFVRKVRPNQVLLYVHPKQRAARPDPATVILEKYNPWTFDSLPFTPDPRMGWVRTKNVRPATVSTVTDRRNRDRPAWSKELNRVGRRQVRKIKLKIPKKVRFLPNMALEALKLEFGLGGTKPRPAWRLGVRRVIKTELRRFATNPKYFVFPLTKPSDTLWRRWPMRTKHSITLAQAAKFVPFQRKLGISV